MQEDPRDPQGPNADAPKPSEKVSEGTISWVERIDTTRIAQRRWFVTKIAQQNSTLESVLKEDGAESARALELTKEISALDGAVKLILPCVMRQSEAEINAYDEMKRTSCVLDGLLWYFYDAIEGDSYKFSAGVSDERTAKKPREWSCFYTIDFEFLDTLILKPGILNCEIEMKGGRMTTGVEKRQDEGFANKVTLADMDNEVRARQNDPTYKQKYGEENFINVRVTVKNKALQALKLVPPATDKPSNLARIKWGGVSLVEGIEAALARLEGAKVWTMDQDIEASGKISVEIAEGVDGYPPVGAKFKLDPDCLTRCCSAEGCTRTKWRKSEVPLYRCSLCLVTYYCSKRHQHADWISRHKDICSRRRDTHDAKDKELCTVRPLILLRDGKGMSSPWSVMNIFTGCPELHNWHWKDAVPAYREMYLSIVRQPVLTDMAANGDSARVAAASCGAIAGILRVQGFQDMHMRTQLAELGACDAVGAALTAHPTSKAVAQWSLKAITLLAVDQGCRTKFGRGVCAAVVSATRDHASDVEVAKAGCSAAYQLAYNHPANKAALLQAGVLPVFRAVLGSGKLPPKDQAAFQRLIYELSK